MLRLSIPRPRRVFVVFLAASVAAHAAILGIVPWFSEQDAGRELPGALQVILGEPVAVLAERPRHARLAEVPARPAAQPSRPTAPQKPALALPEPSADERRSPSVGADFAEPPASPVTDAGSREIVAAAPVSIDVAYLSSPKPGYPPVARRAGEQGTVVLRVLVTREG